MSEAGWKADAGVFGEVHALLQGMYETFRCFSVKEAPDLSGVVKGSRNMKHNDNDWSSELMCEISVRGGQRRWIQTTTSAEAKWSLARAHA